MSHRHAPLTIESPTELTPVALTATRTKALSAILSAQLSKMSRKVLQTLRQNQCSNKKYLTKHSDVTSIFGYKIGIQRRYATGQFTYRPRC